MLQGISYWVRNPTVGPMSRGASVDLTTAPADPDSARQLSQTRPIVFLHGVGFGLVSLQKVMQQLVPDKNAC